MHVKTTHWWHTTAPKSTCELENLLSFAHTHSTYMSQVGYIAPPLTINYHGWWVGKILSWLRWLFGETVVRGNDAGKDDGGGGLLSCVLNHGLL